jgi:hypothetical protein
MEANPDADLPLPQKDYTKSIALYERIIAEYPKYEYIDGCYYMLGYTHSELNSMQLNEDVGKDWFLKLVNEYPQSEFAATRTCASASTTSITTISCSRSRTTRRSSIREKAGGSTIAASTSSRGATTRSPTTTSASSS